MPDVNGFDPVAWSIDGGLHRGELLRVLAFAATSGSEGIVSVGDCKVHQLGTPGTSVTVDSGALLVRNRSSNVDNQTYVANGRLPSTLGIAATGGTPRSDLVVLRVKDPQYSPWGTVVGSADPKTFQYVEPFVIQNVPAGTVNFKSLNLGYSAYALARIDIPASTSVITDAYIKNLREMAQPRRDIFYDRFDITAAADTNSAVGTWVRFPTSIAYANPICPEWATKAYVRADITGPQVVTSTLAGSLRYRLFNGTPGAPGTLVNTKNTYINEQAPGATRQNYVVGSVIDIPTALRGQLLYGQLEWMKSGGTGVLRVSLDTQVVVRIDFAEAAV